MRRGLEPGHQPGAHRARGITEDGTDCVRAGSLESRDERALARYGADETRAYTLDLLESDPQPARLVIGMTEMGTYGVTDDESERVFQEGVRAIMDAIDAFSGV